LPAFPDCYAAEVVGLVVSRMSARAGQLYERLLDETGEVAEILADPRLCCDSPELYRAVKSPTVLEGAFSELREWQRQGIHAAGLGGCRYPRRLSLIHQPPPVIFFRGSLAAVLSERPGVAIVGSRRGDAAGCDLARQFAAAVVRGGGCVISGLAVGIDAAAHRGALEERGEFPTAAVLGNGLASVYPASHNGLAEEIVARGGALISQFEPGEKPYPGNFINRNRVIAGLSDGVLVVQAAQRSGSLVTARYALEENREVMAVPGQVGNPLCAGSNGLLKQGAHLIASVEDLCEIISGIALPAARAPGSVGAAALSDSQRSIVESLRRVGSLEQDMLSGQLGGPENLARDLLELELAEVIVRLPGNQLALRPVI